MRDKQTPKDVCGETILTVDSSDLRFLSAYNNGAVGYVGSSLTVHNPLFFVHRSIVTE